MTFVAYRVSRSIVNLEKKKWQLKISQHYHLNLFSASYTRDNVVELETFENNFISSDNQGTSYRINLSTVSFNNLVAKSCENVFTALCITFRLPQNN